MWTAALAHFDREREQRASALVPDGEGETPAVFSRPPNIATLIFNRSDAKCLFNSHMV